jgi:hypothetical protein
MKKISCRIKSQILSGTGDYWTFEMELGVINRGVEISDNQKDEWSNHRGEEPENLGGSHGIQTGAV